MFWRKSILKFLVDDWGGEDEGDITEHVMISNKSQWKRKKENHVIKVLEKIIESPMTIKTVTTCKENHDTYQLNVQTKRITR